MGASTGVSQPSGQSRSIATYATRPTAGSLRMYLWMCSEWRRGVTDPDKMGEAAMRGQNAIAR